MSNLVLFIRSENKNILDGSVKGISAKLSGEVKTTKGKEPDLLPVDIIDRFLEFMVKHFVIMVSNQMALSSTITRLSPLTTL